MPSAKLEFCCKWFFIASALALVTVYLRKDELPDPGFYDQKQLTVPLQTATTLKPFTLDANGQNYVIKPKFAYDLHGVIVTYSNADGFGNIWHHKRWQDFINLRDLCVIWGSNVQSGVYKKMQFSSDSWTCWVRWPDRATGEQFKSNELSNNHLLTNNPLIKKALMQAQVGDQIHLVGVLAEYANQGSSFKRGTSTTRDDTGNGACETIYLQQFNIIKQANPMLRTLYQFLLWLTAISFLVWIALFFLVPPQQRS